MDDKHNDAADGNRDEAGHGELELVLVRDGLALEHGLLALR